MVYRRCGGCQATCGNLKPFCIAMCQQGCYCPKTKPILINEETNTCGTEDECPKPAEFF